MMYDEVISPYHTFFFTIAVGPYIVTNLVCMCILLCVFIFRRLKNQKKRKNSDLPLPPLSSMESPLLNDDVNIHQLLRRPSNTVKRCLITMFASTFLFCVTASAWGFLPLYVSIPFLTISTWIFFLLLMPEGSPIHLNNLKDISHFRTVSHKSPRLAFIVGQIYRKAKSYPRLFYVGLSAILLAVFFLCFAMAGICVSIQPFSITTRFSRYFQKPLCVGPAPCHVYLTFPENAQSSIIINFQTEQFEFTDETAQVVYDTVSQSSVSSYHNKTTGNTFVYRSYDLNRGVHWVQLENLLENTTYYFRAGIGGHFTEEKKFRTIPKSGNIRFVSGGDIGMSDNAQDMSKVAGSMDPHFAVVGGDIAYANGFQTCYRVWDEWFNMWESAMKTTTGYLIPTIFSIGNHEAGGYAIPVRKVPFFLSYFAQQTNTPGNPLERSTYHAHRMTDNTVIFALDSNHVASPTGDQLEWAQREMSTTYQNFSNKIAVYHIAMYPGASLYNVQRSRVLRSVWLPLFDNNKLNIGFENHDHTYVRTKSLKNDQINENGTMYLGAGCWGVNKRAITRSNMWYMDQWDQDRNFVYVVDMNEQEGIMNFQAIDSKAQVFDTFSRPTRMP